MLVLARQRDETIMIGDDIEVTVIDIRGEKIRLGINAPKDVAVHRKEVYDAIHPGAASCASCGKTFINGETRAGHDGKLYHPECKAAESKVAGKVQATP